MVDFDEVYIAGKHQWERMRERTSEENIYDMIKTGSLIYSNGHDKYFRHNLNILPTSKGDNGINVVRTVLDKDMVVY